MNLVSGGSQSARGPDSEEAGVEWSKRREVRHGGKKLKVLNLKFQPVYFRPQEVIPKLDVVLSEQLVDVGGGGCVLLVERLTSLVVSKRE